MENRQAASNTISQNMNLLHDYSSWPISKCLFRSMVTIVHQKRKEKKERKKERSHLPPFWRERKLAVITGARSISSKEARKGDGREKKTREIALRLDRSRKKFLDEFLLWISRSFFRSPPPLLLFFLLFFSFRLNSPSLKTNEITISSTSLLLSLSNSSLIISAPRRSNFHGR